MLLTDRMSEISLKLVLNEVLLMCYLGTEFMRQLLPTKFIIYAMTGIMTTKFIPVLLTTGKGGHTD